MKRLFFILISCFFLGCSQSHYLNKLTVENGLIPNDFGNKNTTLLINLPNLPNDLRLYKKILEKYYHGKYKVILDSEGKDLDKLYGFEEYRYFLTYYISWDKSSVDVWSTTSSSYWTTTNYNYYIYDRVEEKSYDHDYQSLKNYRYFDLFKGYCLQLDYYRFK